MDTGKGGPLPYIAERTYLRMSYLSVILGQRDAWGDEPSSTVRTPSFPDDRGSFMSPETKLAIWFSFQILGGQIMMPILVATFVFSKTAKRDPTLVNLCGTFILTGFCGCLL